MTSKEEKYDEWRRYFFEVDKEMYEYFIQDIERLEVLDKLVTDDCIAGNEVGLQIVNNLIERSNNYRDENKQLKERLERLEIVSRNRYEKLKKHEALKNKIHHFVATIVINDLIHDFDTNGLVEEIFNQIIEALNKENKDLIRC